MSEPNVVPRTDEGASIGTALKKWLKGWFAHVHTEDITDGTETVTVVQLDDAVGKKHVQLHAMAAADDHSGTASGETAVAPSASQDVDTVPIASVVSVKWVLNISIGSSISETSEILARPRGTNVDWTQFAVLGEAVDYTLSITSDGTDLKLNVTNNEASSITAKIRRFAM